MIAAVVLAAGRSERMGRPKMLLPFGRKTLIETVLAGVLRSCVDDVVVVLGAHREAIGAVVSKFPVRAVFNEGFEEGMLSSVVRGLREVPSAARAFLVVLGDHPSPPAAVIDRLVAAHDGTGKGIVLPAYRGRRGHPVLIDIRYRDRIKGLDPSLGLRQLARDHPDDVLEVPVRTPAVLMDVDRPDDYRKALASRRRRQGSR
jgi:molybdenum cofactor cytidylyltransferase